MFSLPSSLPWLQCICYETLWHHLSCLSGWVWIWGSGDSLGPLTHDGWAAAGSRHFLCPRNTSIISLASKVCGSFLPKEAIKTRNGGNRIKVVHGASRAWSSCVGRPVRGTFPSECSYCPQDPPVQASFWTTEVLDSYWFNTIPQTVPDYLLYGTVYHAKNKSVFGESIWELSREAKAPFFHRDLCSLLDRPAQTGRSGST